MEKNLVASATTTIDADKRRVWDALITPEAIKEYMFGTDVQSDWKVGNKITWSGEFKGKKYEDKGEILEFEPGEVLSYSHFSPLAGKPDEPENYHTVTIKLSEDGGATKVVLDQDNNADENAQAESEKNWNVMLAGLKKYVEGSASSSASA